MDLQLQGRHVLITGGSKGIGLACARAFLDEGARVSLVSRSAANLQHGAAHLAQAIGGGDAQARIATFAADLKDPAAAVAALDAAEKAGGPVEILVNSAGAAKRTGPDDLTPQAWHDSMEAKYFTYLTNTRAKLLRLKELWRCSASEALRLLIDAYESEYGTIHLRRKSK